MAIPSPRPIVASRPPSLTQTTADPQASGFDAAALCAMLQRVAGDASNIHGVVPADWVAESLRPHIATGDGLGYGYQWWTGTVDWEGKKLAWSAGFGNGGQRRFVVPELDLTVVVTAGAYNDPQIRRTVTEIFRQIVASAAAIVDRADDEVGGGQARRE